MADLTYQTGGILINPPVPAARLAGSKFVSEWDNAAEVTARADETHPGQYIEISAGSGTPNPENITRDVDELLALIGPGHTYAGHIQCQGPNGPEDLWRVRVLNGAAVDEDARIVYPADHRIPDGPAVTFDSTAARAWLTETVPLPTSRTPVARATTFGVQPDETYDPIGFDDRPGAWLALMLAALHDHAAAPLVWQTAPTADIDVIETYTMHDDPDGGAVLVLFIAGTRLATHRLRATDLAVRTTDGAGHPNKRQLDAAIETLTTAAQQLNTIVEHYRSAQLTASTTTDGLAGHLSPDDIETALHTLGELADGADWNADLSTAQHTVAAVLAQLRHRQNEPPH